MKMIWMAGMPSLMYVRSEVVEAMIILMIILRLVGHVTCCFNNVVHNIIKDLAVLLGSIKGIDNEVIIDTREKLVLAVAQEPVCQGFFK